MANEFVTRTGLIVSGSTFLPAATSASKGYILSFDTSTKEVYYMSTSSVTVTVPGSDTQVIYNNGGSFGASPNFVFSGSNIGIGTSSPSYKLDVSGSGRFTSAVYAVGADFGGTISVVGSDYYHVDDDPTLNASANDQIIALLRLRDRGSNGGFTGVIRPLLTSENGGGGQHNVQLYEAGLRIGPYSGGTSAFASPSAVFEGKGTTSTINLLDIQTNGGSTALFVSASGFVGIGATSPESFETFSVRKQWSRFSQPTSTDYTLIEVSNTTNTARLGVENSSGGGITGGSSPYAAVIASIGNRALQLSTSGSVVMTITGSNVGIGTTTPGAELVVNSANNNTRVFIQNAGSTKLEVGYGPTGYGFTHPTGEFIGHSDNLYFGQISGISTNVTFTTGGNVGIGTTSPAQQLHLTGNILLENNQIIRWKNTSGAERNIFSLDTNNQLQVGGSIDAIRFLTNDSSERMRITSTGNVGINKTSPSTTLDVSGSVLISGSLTVSGSSTFTNIGPAVFTGSITQNASTASFGGLVGIGTTSPSSKLEVYTATGDTKLTIATTGGNSYVPRLSLDKRGDSAWNITSPAGGFNFAIDQDGTTRLWIASSTGNVGIGTTSPSRKLIVYDTDANVPTIGLRTDGSGTTTDDGFDLQFASSNTFLFNRENGYTAFGTNNTERVRIAATGDTHIGTTAYTGVGGSGYLMVKNVIGIVPDNTASANNRNWAIQANGQFSGSLDFVTSAASASFPNDAYRVSFTRTGGIVASSFTGSFSGSVSAPGSTTQIVYNSGGALAADSGLVYSGSRVGIGTTTPVSSLQVNRSSQTYNSPTASGALVVSNLAGGAAVLDIGMDATNLAYLQSRYIDNSAVYQLLLNPAGGNVGIGTTTPSTALTVAGAISSSGATYVGGNLSVGTTYNSFAANIAGTTYVIGASVWVNDGYGYANASSGGTGFFPSSSTAISINSGGNTRMFIASGSGNVGIGTTTPDTPLVVQGGAAGTGGWNRTATLSATYPGLIFNSNGTKWGGMAYDYSAAMRFWVNASNNDIFAGTLALSILNNGNVGIGNSDPAYKLDVAGDINTSTGVYRIGGSTILAGTTNVVVGSSGATGTVSLNNTSGAGLVLNGANVGIGTTSPDAKLTISGSGVDLATFYNNNTKNLTITSAGNLSFNTNTSLGLLWSPASLKFEGQTQGITARPYDPSYVTFTVAGASSQTANLQEWQSSGGSVYSVVNATGSFGIGTTSPSAKLDVYGVASSDTTPGLRVLGNDWGSISNAMVRFDGGPASDGNILLLKSQNNNRSDSEIFEIQNSGSNTVFVVKGTGNVGIGVTSPTYNLEVSGSGYISGSLTVAGTITAQKLNVQQITSSVVYSSGSNVFGNSLANTQTFTGSLQVTGSTHYLLGNVGIGTTSPYPSARLQVKTATDINVAIQTGTTNLSGIKINAFNDAGDTNIPLELNGSILSLKTGETERMHITSGGNVGIGTTTPFGTTSNRTVLSVNGTTDVSINVGTGGTQRAYLYGASTYADLGTIGSLPLLFSPNNTEVMRITSAGSVGIGTSSPQYKLDVNGSFRVDGTNGDFIVASTGNDIYFTRNDANYFYADQANSAISFMMGAGYSQSLYLKNNGFVGINNVNPTAKLDVTGNSKFLAAFSSYTTDGLFSADALPGVYVSTPGGASRGTYIGYRDFGGGQYWGRIGVSGSVAWSLGIGNSAGNNFSIGLNNDSGLDYLTISSGSGNVGIGTTSPARKLVVNGDTWINLTSDYFGGGTTVQISAGGTGAVGVQSNTFYLYPYSSNTATSLVYGYNGGASWNLTNAGGSNRFDFYSYAASANIMSISSSGNVGIGTATPDQKLELFSSSDVALRIHKNSVGEVIMGISGSAGADATQFITNTNGFDFRGDSNTFPGGGSSRLFISSSGNVGIGTSSPTRKLDVNGTSIFRDFTTVVSSNGNPVSNTTWLSTDSGITNIYTGGNSTVQLNSNGVSYFNGGNVGIGTTSPTGRLTVAPYNTVNSSSIEFTDADNAVISSYYSQTFAVDNTNTQSGRQFVFSKGGKGYGTQTKTMMVIDADSGNVGIGTTTPQAALSIAATGSKWANDNNTYFQPTGSIFLSAEATVNKDNWIGIAGNYNSTTGSANLLLQANFRDVGSQAGHYVSSQGISLGNAVFTIGKLTTSTSTTTPPTKVEQFRIDGSGNVGIGTTNPAHKLDVIGNARIGQNSNSSTNASIDLTSGGSGYNAFIDYGYYDTFDASIWRAGVFGDDGSKFKIQNTGAGPVYDVFTISGTSTFAFLTGSVGIGTTSPAYKLQVSGAGNASGVLAGFTGTGPSGSISIGHSGNGGSIGYANIGAGAASNVFYVTTGAGTIGSGFAMDNNGNVGIGTTSSFTTGGTAKLSILGSSVMLTMGASTSDLMYFRQAGAGEYQIQTNNGGNDGNIQLQPYGGKVGIGTTTPNQKLSVEGGNIQLNANNAAANYYLYLNKKSGQDGGILFNRDNANDWQLTNGAGNGDLIFYSYGISNDAVTFKRATGNVGIGTTSPSYKLQVSGAIAIENQGTTTIETTTFSGSLTTNTNIASVPTASFKAAFFDYYVASGSVNMRAGTVMAVHNNSTSRYTDTSTADIGTTAAVDFSTSIVAGSLVLTANISSGTWEVKTAYRAL